MDNYSKVLEFFMENNILLNENQMKELRIICNEGALKKLIDNRNKKDIISNDFPKIGEYTTDEINTAYVMSQEKYNSSPERREEAKEIIRKAKKALETQ